MHRAALAGDDVAGQRRKRHERVEVFDIICIETQAAKQLPVVGDVRGRIRRGERRAISTAVFVFMCIITASVMAEFRRHNPGGNRR